MHDGVLPGLRHHVRPVAVVDDLGAVVKDLDEREDVKKRSSRVSAASTWSNQIEGAVHVGGEDGPVARPEVEGAVGEIVAAGDGALDVEVAAAVHLGIGDLQRQGMTGVSEKEDSGRFLRFLAIHIPSPKYL